MDQAEAPEESESFGGGQQERVWLIDSIWLGKLEETWGVEKSVGVGVCKGEG